MPDIIRPTSLDTKETYVDMGDGTHAKRVAIGNGLAGVVVTTNTSPVSGQFTVIQVLEDANFSAFSETGASGQAMTGFVIPAGVAIFGRITGYTLASGKVRAHT